MKFIRKPIENKLTEAEGYFAWSFSERMGKLIVVGLAGILVTMLVEDQYDKFIDRRHERASNAEA